MYATIWQTLIIVVKPGETLDEETVMAHCLANLAKFKIPQSVVFVKELPRTATGKVLKRVLREQFPGPFDKPVTSKGGQRGC